MRRAALPLLVLILALVSCTDAPPPPVATPALPPDTPTATTPSPPAPATPTITATVAPPTATTLERDYPRADRIDLARRFRGVSAQVTPVAHDDKVGDRRDFWVIQSEPPRAFQVNATLRAVGRYAALWVQSDRTVSDADIRRAADDFDYRVYPVVTRLFGEPKPALIDPDPRITILHLRLPGVGGYFTDVDQTPKSVVPISNERRMIYLDLGASAPGTEGYLYVAAHEFQHLIHQGARPDSESWFNEGLSELAGEAAQPAGATLRAHRDAPDTQLNDWAAGGSNAAHYAAAFSFLRYLLSHYGGTEQAQSLVARGSTGVNAVQSYLRDGGFGASFESVFADWLVANYLNLPGNGRFSNAGQDTRVRTVTRLSGPDQASADVRQFGADYFEITPRGGDLVFQFKGETAVRRVPAQPASGAGQWWSGRGDAMDATLTRSLDLRSVQRATLRFKTWYAIENGFDYGYVAVSTDNGQSWKALAGRQTTDRNPLGQAYGPGYTGASGGGSTPAWVDEEIDLTAYAGNQILLRFEYVTDEAAVDAGMAIDDIEIPELGLRDDVETDGGWTASGFVRLTAPLKQRFLLQYVREEGGQWVASPVPVGDDGAAEVRVPASVGRAAIIVAGATYGTNLPASYSWQLLRP